VEGSIIFPYYTWGMEKIKIENHTFSGGLWIAGWLFSIGYLQMSFWQGVLAIILWPYYLGVSLSASIAAL